MSRARLNFPFCVAFSSEFPNTERVLAMADCSLSKKSVVENMKRLTEVERLADPAYTIDSKRRVLRCIALTRPCAIGVALHTKYFQVKIKTETVVEKKKDVVLKKKMLCVGCHSHTTINFQQISKKSNDHNLPNRCSKVLSVNIIGPFGKARTILMVSFVV